MPKQGFVFMLLIINVLIVCQKFINCGISPHIVGIGYKKGRLYCEGNKAIAVLYALLSGFRCRYSFLPSFNEYIIKQP